VAVQSTFRPIASVWPLYLNARLLPDYALHITSLSVNGTAESQLPALRASTRTKKPSPRKRAQLVETQPATQRSKKPKTCTSVSAALELEPSAQNEPELIEISNRAENSVRDLAEEDIREEAKQEEEEAEDDDIEENEGSSCMLKILP
jgi:hypothetical protein